MKDHEPVITDRLTKIIVIRLVEESLLLQCIASLQLLGEISPSWWSGGGIPSYTGALWVSNGRQFASFCWEERRFCYQGANCRVSNMNACAVYCCCCCSVPQIIRKATRSVHVAQMYQGRCQIGSNVILFAASAVIFAITLAAMQPGQLHTLCPELHSKAYNPAIEASRTRAKSSAGMQSIRARIVCADPSRPPWTRELQSPVSHLKVAHGACLLGNAMTSLQTEQERFTVPVRHCYSSRRGRPDWWTMRRFLLLLRLMVTVTILACSALLAKKERAWSFSIQNNTAAEALSSPPLAPKQRIPHMSMLCSSWCQAVSEFPPLQVRSSPDSTYSEAFTPHIRHALTATIPQRVLQNCRAELASACLVLYF